MSDNQNRISKFWLELKRRKVVRVVTVYAAAAFVILELVGIIAEPFGLPDWTIKLVFVLLAVGLIVSVVLSWIYDVSPGGAIVKTGTEQLEDSVPPKNSGGWKVATYISFAVIIGLVIFHVTSDADRSDDPSTLDKSVAVLPFIDDSPDKDNEHFINGIMEDLLINLQSINDLRVPGRTSVEVYRNNPKPILEIAEELNVDYILEASVQRYGDKIRLRVQLREGANDKQVWSDSYDVEIKSLEDIFQIQSQLASSIAAELRAVISPEEKEMLARIPTSSLTAYDLYLRGREELWRFTSDVYNTEVLDNARMSFYRTLEYDPEFAPAYAELASVYHEKFYLSGTLEEHFLDSILHFADRALSLDEYSALAHSLKGSYYYIRKQPEQALQEFNRALEINSNDYKVYLNMGRVVGYSSDVGEAIFYYRKATSFLSGSELALVLNQLSEHYSTTGFFQQALDYAEEAFELNRDTLNYLKSRETIAFNRGNHEEAIAYLLRGYALDSNDVYVLLRLGWHYMILEQFEDALYYVRKWMRMPQLANYFEYNMMHRVGYILWQNGYEQEAEVYFRKQKNHSERINELNLVLSEAKLTYYDLAGIYAFMGEKEKALENLRIYNRKETEPWVNMFKILMSDPLFNNLRSDPEFQQIAQDIEVKCQAEHKRVGKFLEERGML